MDLADKLSLSEKAGAVIKAGQHAETGLDLAWPGDKFVEK
jgi:hypothetical protein